jgi:hypothetical protein
LSQEAKTTDRTTTNYLLAILALHLRVLQEKHARAVGTTGIANPVLQEEIHWLSYVLDHANRAATAVRGVSARQHAA